MNVPGFQRAKSTDRFAKARKVNGDAIRRTAGVGLLLALLAWSVSATSAADLTRDEVQFLNWASGGVRKGENLLRSPSPDLIELDRMAEQGVEDLRQAATLQLMLWTIARINSPDAETAWKVADAEGRPQLYGKWAERTEKHLATNYSKHFPFRPTGLVDRPADAANPAVRRQASVLVSTKAAAVASELTNQSSLELGRVMAQRASAAGLKEVDPRSDDSLLAEFTGGKAMLMWVDLSNRGPMPLKNVVVITHTRMHEFKPQLNGGARALAGVNNLLNSLSPVSGADSDVYEAQVLLDQWRRGRDVVAMFYLPELPAKQKIGLPVCRSDSGECAQRCSIAVYCDDFFVRELPAIGLVAWQRKDVAARLRRGVVGMDGGKPVVVADVAYEQEFVKARKTRKP